MAETIMVEKGTAIMGGKGLDTVDSTSEAMEGVSIVDLLEGRSAPRLRSMRFFGQI